MSGSAYTSEMLAEDMDADETVHGPQTPRLEIQRRELRTPGTGSSWSRVDTASTVVTPLRRGAHSAYADDDAASISKTLYRRHFDIEAFC